MEYVDLLLAWHWPLDEPFISRIERRCSEKDLSTRQVSSSNVALTTDAVRRGDLVFRAFFDRASDESDTFVPLASEAHRRCDISGNGCSPLFVNRPHLARRAADKATMHLEFLTHGIHVPHTIILPPAREVFECVLEPSELVSVGTPFVIKPANTTGGGAGVFMNGRTVEDIQRQRLVHPSDKYLVQQRIVPAYLSEMRAWFRAYYAFGATFLCWWDDRTHIYEVVSSEEEEMFGLHPMRDLIRTTAKICGLDFFSAEYTMASDGRFVSVDYVNEMCDMRPRSTTPNGIPEELLEWVVAQLILTVQSIERDRL